MLYTGQFKRKMTGNKTISLGVTAKVPELSTTMSVSAKGRIVDLAAFAAPREYAIAA